METLPPSVGPTAGETAAASALPTPEPTEAAVATPDADPCVRRPYTGPLPGARIVPRSAIRVQVAELNIRSGPCTAARKLATLEKGTVLIVSEAPYGPVRADGYAWYSVIFPPGVDDGELPKLPGWWFPEGTDTDGGWIAAHSRADSFVAPLAPRCPTTIDMENIVAMLPSEWLACFDDPITVEGTFGCGGCGGTGGPIAEPTWLADPFEGDFRVSWEYPFTLVPIGLHFKPDGPERPIEGSIIRVTMHVDDPAAASCTFAWRMDEPEFVVPDETAIAWCRERFVVDSYEVLGTDPNYGIVDD